MQGSLDVYIKLKSKHVVEVKKAIKLKEIATVVANDEIISELEELEVYDVPESKDGMHSVYVIDIIKKIKKINGDIKITSLGEDTAIIEYHKNVIKENKLWEVIKVTGVCLTVFFGAAVAIMTFHTDVSMPEVHKQLYEIFMGVRIDRPLLIQIPYSIGIAAGVITFFNHFGHKVEKYPTPLEVEISKYYADILSATGDKIRKAEQ